MLHVPHIATQKASVGMYSGCDKLSLQILFVYFLTCHPYFIFQFSLIVFYACYCSFFIALRVINP